ncbi:hypothetical protein C5167_035098 [Papaver somniferum]|uniref:NAB domain-containing protein n=1 Tax=Papaver somniferum TaxID=3469 RepID=A0A4Y7KI82_PAPSO|nr:protein NETWORKED 4A-like [Papaver somniferum]RZC71871.1 hypothetical protein C5167_035098 [Papaver somniferum]
MSKKTLKRLESKKSHSWWFDSHIIPKSNKWLADNLQEMDLSVKRMLKLIEEDGDSFAKKAEMYYEKRPELISQVEEFYRMYRALAERYGNLTKELRKNIPPNQLQSQTSGISDAGSESGPPMHFGAERKHTRRKSVARAAGFDVFLGSRGGSSEKAESDDSSLSPSDSETESESIASSKITYSDSLAASADDLGLSQRIIELEAELRDVKLKLQMAEEENSSITASMASHDNGDYEKLLGRIQWYEEELNVANAKLHCAEEEIQRITNLKTENETTDALSTETTQVLELQENIAKLTLDLEKSKSAEAAMDNVLEETRVSNEKLRLSEEEVSRLKLELQMAKSSSRDIDVCMPEQKDPNVENLNTEIQELKLAISDAELKFSTEKSQLQKVISDLEEDRRELETKLKNLESSIQTLIDDGKRVEQEKIEFQVLQANREKEISSEMERWKLNIETLTAERDNLLNGKARNSFTVNVGSRDADRLREMEDRLKMLQGIKWLLV